jgi:hypothetical protein
MRFVAVAALAALLCSGLTASAQRAPDEAGRFTIAPQDDGFLRLDTRSGAVSHCRKDTTGEWTCVPFNEADAVRSDAIAALEKRIATLSAELDSLRADLARLRGGTAPAAPHQQVQPPPAPPLPHMPQPETGKSALPDEAELERALSFMEIVMRRVLTMVQEMKRDDPQ